MPLNAKTPTVAKAITTGTFLIHIFFIKFIFHKSISELNPLETIFGCRQQNSGGRLDRGGEWFKK